MSWQRRHVIEQKAQPRHFVPEMEPEDIGLDKFWFYSAEQREIILQELSTNRIGKMYGYARGVKPIHPGEW